MNNVNRKEILEKRLQSLRKLILWSTIPFILASWGFIFGTNRDFNDNKILFFVMLLLLLIPISGLGIYKVNEKKYMDEYPD